MSSVTLGAGPTSSNFPGGFANGVTVRGMPLLNSYPGRVFWLNSSAQGASDGNRGTFDRPFATLAGVITAAGGGGAAQPMAARGDVVMVGAGHAETISSSTALNLSISGLQIIGLGVGTLRPTFTLDTATTTTINVTANNITIQNCLFVANFAAIAACFTLTTAKELDIINCDFRDTSSVLNFKWIVNTGTTSNDVDGLTLSGCNFYGLGATSATRLVNLQQTMTRLNIQACYVTHTATSQAGLLAIAAGKVVTHAEILDNICVLTGADGGGVGVLVSTNQSTNTGILARNFTHSLEATSPIIVTASSGFRFNLNYYTHTADKNGYLIPAADS